MKQKPLLTDEEKKSAGVLDLSYDFACRTIRLYRYLTTADSGKKTNQAKTRESEFVMSKQVYRSGTSIGANVREAQHAQSDPDFLSKMSIALKEADETSYWIDLLHDNGYITKESFTSLDTDIHRIIRVLMSITKSTKERIANHNTHK